MGSTARLFRPKHKNASASSPSGPGGVLRVSEHRIFVVNTITTGGASAGGNRRYSSAGNRSTLRQLRYSSKSACTALGTPRDHALPSVAIPRGAHGVLTSKVWAYRWLN